MALLRSKHSLLIRHGRFGAVNGNKKQERISRILYPIVVCLDSFFIEMLRRVSTGALRSAPTLRARLQQQAAAHAATATAAPVPSGANKSNVKIVATIGPASEHMPKLQHVVDAGLKIMRINFSHGEFCWLSRRCSIVLYRCLTHVTFYAPSDVRRGRSPNHKPETGMISCFIIIH